MAKLSQLLEYVIPPPCKKTQAIKCNFRRIIITHNAIAFEHSLGASITLFIGPHPSFSAAKRLAVREVMSKEDPPPQLQILNWRQYNIVEDAIARPQDF